MSHLNQRDIFKAYQIDFLNHLNFDAFNLKPFIITKLSKLITMARINISMTMWIRIHHMNYLWMRLSVKTLRLLKNNGRIHNSRRWTSIYISNVNIVLINDDLKLGYNKDF